MADATLQILGLGTKAVPLDYNVTGNQPLDLIAVKADFDGSAAGVDFVPVIQILSDADHVMAQSKGPTVTAGDSATVTFAPFLEDTGGGGADALAVHFNTAPQDNTFLTVGTTAAGTGFDLVANNGGAFNIESSGGAGGFVGITTSDGEVFIGSTSIVNRLAAGGAFEVQDDGAFQVFRVFDTRDFQVRAAAFDVQATTAFIMALPNVNPGGTNRLWNNAGVVNIT